MRKRPILCRIIKILKRIDSYCCRAVVASAQTNKSGDTCPKAVEGGRSLLICFEDYWGALQGRFIKRALCAKPDRREACGGSVSIIAVSEFVDNYLVARKALNQYLFG
jgi:hypothetical protein